MTPSISTTLGSLAQAEAVLASCCTLKLAAKSAYHVAKLARLVAQETRHFYEQRDALIKELGTKREDGGFELKRDSDAFPRFGEQINELAAVPVEIPWSPITLEMFGDEKVSAADLQALGPLFAEPEP